MEPIMKRRPVNTYELRALCPTCPGQRLLKFTGTQLLSYPPMYPHECQTCGYSTNLDAIYPKIEWY
jgi:hypothetical protein